MEVKWLLRISEIFVLLLVTTSLPFYHQDDYDIKLERMEIVWYNQSYAKDVKVNYFWRSRKERVINASGYLLINALASDVPTGELQLYKFMSNEYRHFPLRVGTNLCEEYARNNFGMRRLLKNISNVHACPLEKGFYYVYNFKFDFSLLPPFIPRGNYKAEGKLYFNKEFVGELHAYGSVSDKPMKWD